MDAPRFDALARAWTGTTRTRRGMAAGLAAGAALLAAGRSAPPVPAKKKSKTCQFAKTETVWTLKKGCTTKKQIELPDGVALDGAGKTIRLAGTPDAMGLAGVKGGSVRNLTVDGSGLTGNCEPASFCGIFAGGGSVDAVAVRNLPCGTGIVANLAPTMVTNSLVQNVGGGIGIAAFDEATVQDNTITDCDSGILASGAFADVAVIGNRVSGPGEVPQKVFGIGFVEQATGSISGNDVRNFFSSVSTACGIVMAAGTTPVLQNDNTFTPPGNEQNVCDFRN